MRDHAHAFPLANVLFLTRCCLCIAAASGAFNSAHGQTYPVKPLRIISPYSPGGLGDLLPRAVAAGLTESLGQQVIVENKPGASQIIGMQAAAKAPPDGYTLVFGSVTSLAINPSAHKSLPYDPVRDFAPIALCVTTPLSRPASFDSCNVSQRTRGDRENPAWETYVCIGRQWIVESPRR
jgi:tripartite-type tricarboxylate transporter receptor subunit TctC